MALDTFNQEAAQTGGTWVKLEKKGDHFKGLLLDIEIRDRTTPAGDVVLSRKTQKPRKVYIVTYRVDPDPTIENDQGTRHFQANESAQGAIRDANRDAGGFKAGGLFTLGIKKEKEDEYRQHEYLCKYEAPAPGAEIMLDTPAVVEEEDPF